MPSEPATTVTLQLDQAKALWDETATPEIKAIFKKQYDAFMADDRSMLVAEGLPQFYAAMALGKDAARKEFKEGVPSVSANGNIDSDGKFEKYDLAWGLAIAVFLKNLVEFKYEGLELPAPAPGYTPTVIPNDAAIAIVGDWGTGYWIGDNTPAAQVGNVVTNTVKPDIVVHLGDVYYYGSQSQVQDNLVSLLPQGGTATFNLNSNHDMYSVSVPYFSAVARPPFGRQGNTSYFVLTNDHWIIVGLDTAYLSSVEDAFLYGSLGKLELMTHELIQNEQTRCLTDMAQIAATERKKLIILTHHNGYGGPGMTIAAPVLPFSEKTLWSQVTTLIQPYLENEKAFWYWGHSHSGYTLKAIDNIHARCVGHSAIPWGKGSDFFTGSGSNIEWFEATPMPDNPPLTMNGLMSVTLNGTKITENYYTQTGTETYTAVNGVMSEV